MLLALVLSFAAQAPASEETTSELWITGWWLWDGVADSRRVNRGILVRNGVIVAIDFNDAARASPTALGVADRLGTIEPDRLADMVIAGGDSLADIKSARNVRLVVKGGVVHDPATLLKSAEGKIGPRGSRRLGVDRSAAASRMVLIESDLYSRALEAKMERPWLR